MSKVKNFFKGIVTNYKNSFKQYTATNIVIILTTLFLVFAYDGLPGTIINKTLTIAILSAINFFACETYLKKLWKRGISYVVGLGIAIGFEQLVYSARNSEAIARIVMGYAIIVFLIGLMQAIKNTKADIGEYEVKAFKNIFSVGIIYIILNIGLTLITLIFISLILSNTGSNLISRIQIALLGLFALPATLIAITEIKEDISKFIKVIVLYVMLPLTILATVIIYIYMAKILILREIPANSIFRILTGLFIVAFPVWVMIDPFKKESKLIEKICKILPIAFIPFLLLQTYSICARIDGNGLTPSRYIGIAFIIFETITIFLSLYKERKYLINFITVGTVIIAVSTILPVVNMQSASNISQSNRLKKAWKENQIFSDLSEENKKIAQSAYSYLENQSNANKYIPNYIDKDAIKEYIVGKEEYYYKYNQKRIEYPKMYIIGEQQIIPIGEYKYMQAVTVSEYDIKLNNMKKIQLTESTTVNLVEYLSKLIEKNEANTSKIEEYIKSNNTIKIDDNKDFYITDLTVTYSNEETISILYLSIDGYLLQK